MNENRSRKQRQKVSPIREGIAIHKEITKIKPFINISSTSAGVKLQKKKTANAGELQRKRIRSRDLLRVTGSILNLLEQTLIDHSYAIFLTDEEGYIIEFRSDAETYHAYQSNEINLGFQSDNETGNNSSLWTNSMPSPVIVEEVEYYTLNINGWTCCGVPIRNLEDKLIGLLEIAVPGAVLPPHTLAILECACQVAERELLELKEKEKFSQAVNIEKWILDNLRQTVIALDENFKILYVNKFGFELVGLPEADIIGHSLLEVLPLGQQFKYCVDSVLSGEEDSTEFELGLSLHEKQLYLSVQASRLSIDQDKLTGLLLVIN